MEMKTDVLIVGAGPVGMTLALTLQRGGVERILLVDRQPTTGTTPRAAIVWSRTLEIFDLLGISEGWREVGVPVRAFDITFDGKSNRVPLTQTDSPFLYPVGIAQDVTERLLDQAVRNTAIDYRRGVEVTALKIEANGVTAQLRSGDGTELMVNADWVIGCEGGHSLTREAAGIARIGDKNPGVQLIQGDFKVQSSFTIEPGIGYLMSHSTQSGLFLLPESRDGHYRVLITAEDDGAQEPPTLEQIQEKATQFLPDLKLSETRWCNRFRTQHQIAEHYRAGRAFVAGDAAHVWVPVGGQGMNIGIQDAFDLGWKLAGVVQGELTEAVLDTYEVERRPIGQRNINETEQLFHALFQAHSSVDLAVKLLLPFALKVPSFASGFAGRLAQTGVHYSEDLLVASDRAGERAPDAFFSRTSDGNTLRFYDLLREGNWVMLGWVLEAKDAPRVGKTLEQLAAHSAIHPYLIDATKEGLGAEIEKNVVRLRDIPHAAAEPFERTHSGIDLIRPDGFFAYRGEPAGKSLSEFLARFLNHERGTGEA